MKQEIRILAHKIWVAFGSISHFKALRLAILKTKLIESLSSGISFFLYQKPNGELRQTLGTLDPEILPPYDFKTSGNPKRELLLTVWDTEKFMWRSFRIDRVKIMYI